MENSNEYSMNAQTENVTNEVKNDNTQKPASGKKGEDNKTSKKKKRKENNFNLTCARYRKVKKAETKYHCIGDEEKINEYSLKRAIAMSNNGYNRDTFLNDARAYIKLLLDHSPFNTLCKSQNFDPYSAATHLVMEGSSKIKRTLIDDLIKHGSLRLTLQSDWKTPLFTKEDLRLNQPPAPEPLAPQQAA